MSVFKIFATGSVAIIAFLAFAIYAQPAVTLEDKGGWLPVPDDMPPASRNLLCSMTECRYVNMTLQYYLPHYYAKVTVYEPAIAYVILVAGTLATISAAYFASRIEDMPTKKAVAIAAGVYGAGMVALMMVRKDFRAAAPILAPLAAALMASAFILILLLRAAGHDVAFKIARKRRKDGLTEQKIENAIKHVKKRKIAKRILLAEIK